MWQPLKDLSLGIGLIVAAASALLLSDLSSRKKTSHPASGLIPVALMQFASNPVFDETSQGIIDGLAAGGFRDGEAIRLQRFNAEGDIPTTNLIASRISDGSFKLVATSATVCLQAVANANRSGGAAHVFCAVSDPIAAGVGIKALGSPDKPAHLTGIGSAQPVEEIFRIAKKVNPELKVVGVVWNPSEANSEVCTRRARAISKELGIELIEAPIEGTRDVREAAQALAHRGAQAYWAGGDATVMSAIDTLIAVARQNHVPVFSNIGGHTKRGALFDLGANYYQVGYKAGGIAAEVLAGKPATGITVEDYMPMELGFNLQALAGLRDPWQPPAEVLKQAVTVIAADGTVSKKEGASLPSPASRKKPFKIAAIAYSDNVPTEESMEGFRRGLKEAGFKEGEDCVVNFRCAQGDMSLLPSLFAAADLDKPDLYLTLSTPTLQTAVKRVKTTPVVFTLVADAITAGAGKSDEDHLPNVTGIYIMSRCADMAELLKTYYPQWKRIGSLVASAEDNSVQANKLFAEELAKRGITLVNVSVNQSGEMTEAATALCRKEIDAVVQVPCNLVSSGFVAVTEACRRSRMPLFGFIQDAARKGAALVLSRDYADSAEDAAKIAVRILRDGEDPAKIPLAAPHKTVLMINASAARTMGIVIPPDLLQKADVVLP